jgi:hypothetical protein
MVNFYRSLLPNCAQVLKPLTDLLRGSGLLPPRRPSKMLNASWQWRCPSNILPQMLNFPWPLMSPILISRGHATIGDHLDSFHASSQTWNHVIQLLTANYWLLWQQSNISVIFAKVELFNFGQIINRLLLLFPVFQPPFRLDNNAIWHSFQNLMYEVCSESNAPDEITSKRIILKAQLFQAFLRPV